MMDTTKKTSFRGLFPTLFLGVLILLTHAACSSDSEEEQEDTIKILACNPLTGFMNFVGPVSERSMQLAVDEINAAGGILGKELALLKADTHSNRDMALTETAFYYGRYREDVVAIAGATIDEISKGLLSEIAGNTADYKEMIPIISPASSSPEFSLMLDWNNIFFRTVPISYYQGEVLADKAFRMGFTRGSVVSFNNTNGQQLAATFKRNFEENGDEYEVTSSFYTEISASTVTDALDAATADNPEFLLVISSGDDGRIILHQWALKHASLTLFLTDTLMSDLFFGSLDPYTIDKLNAGTVNGVFPGSPSSSEGYRKFIESFCSTSPDDCSCPRDRSGCDKTVGGQAPAYITNAYDAIYIIALAIMSTGHQNPAWISRGNGWDVRRVVESISDVTNPNSGDDVRVNPGEWQKAVQAIEAGQNIDYQGASIFQFDFDSIGDPTSAFYVYWTIQDGRIVNTNSDGVEESAAINMEEGQKFWRMLP